MVHGMDVLGASKKPHETALKGLGLGRPWAAEGEGTSSLYGKCHHRGGSECWLLEGWPPPAPWLQSCQQRFWSDCSPGSPSVAPLPGATGAPRPDLWLS